jgi:hypothetical protein
VAITKNYKRNDTGPPITITCFDGTNPKDLTGASSAKFLMGTITSEGVSTIKAQGAMVFDADRTTGKVTYTWGATDLNTPGEFKVEVEITFANGTKQTFPSGGYLTVTVMADVG